MSDLVPVLVPQTAFASFSVLSGTFASDQDAPSVTQVAFRLPYVVLWVCLQLLVLDLANQRLPDSVAEDKINKPWRAIPSQRMTSETALKLLLISIFAASAVSVKLDCVSETLLLFTLNWMYNDLGCANSHWVLRNIMNAAGLTCMGAGATRVACQPGTQMDNTKLHFWWLLCAGVLVTTIQCQDLYDQEGDAVRKRSTAPLLLGDDITRWSIAAFALAWSAIIPAMLQLRLLDNWLCYLLPELVAIVIALRLLFLKKSSADRTTFKIWAVWTICIYILPVMGSN